VIVLLKLVIHSLIAGRNDYLILIVDIVLSFLHLPESITHLLRRIKKLPGNACKRQMAVFQLTVSGYVKRFSNVKDLW